ncbi:MAG: hypothetical protein MI824_25900 [Hyphomicrobiales bacterium]|nr:hypothetical protein [Hyphomicrobiales bacterium]
MSEASQRALLWLETTVDQAEGLVVCEALLQVVNGGMGAGTGPEQVQGLARTLSRFGFGLAPDPVCSLFRSEPQDRVLLFRLPEASDAMIVPSNRYRKALLLVTLALVSELPSGPGFAAQADRLEAFADGLTDLSEAERVGLAANQAWHRKNPDRLAQLCALLASVDQDQRLKLARTATALPVDDARHTAEFTRLSEQVHGALNLDAPQLPQTTPAKPRPALAQGPEQPSLPSGVGHAASGPAIAAAPGLPQPVKSEPSPPIEFAEIASAVQRQRLLSALTARSIWPRADFDATVADFGLSPDEAIASLNQWSLDQYDELLIRGEDPIRINTEPGVEYLQAV